MADLPPGQGHAKHSNPALIEATRAKVARKTKATAAPAVVPAPEELTMDAGTLAAENARFQVTRAAQDSRRSEDILRQLKEMNFYLRALAEKQGVTFKDEDVLAAIGQ